MTELTIGDIIDGVPQMKVISKGKPFTKRWVYDWENREWICREWEDGPIIVDPKKKE